MATATLSKPVAERVSVLETKLEHVDEKIDDLKVDVKEMHDCLDNTRDLLDSKLDEMLAEYRNNRDRFYEHANALHEEDQQAHQALASKVAEIEKFKNKWMYLILGAAAALGWMGHMDFGLVTKLLGL
jgi:uncharacterized coiled-coil DUF342 family protein